MSHAQYLFLVVTAIITIYVILGFIVTIWIDKIDYLEEGQMWWMVLLWPLSLIFYIALILVNDTIPFIVRRFSGR